MMLEQNSNYGLGGRFDRALKEKVESTFAFGTDEYWMEQALLESMNSNGLSQPNPLVGCVLVKDQKVISSGFTQKFGHEHAERSAFQKLDPTMDLSDVTAYVTLEPCTHFGSQPPCVDLFLNSSIKRVVIAAQDPDSRVNGEGIRRLRAAGIEVKLQVLENEAKLLNFPFLQNRLKQRPIWIGKWAETEAGFLADADGNSKWISIAKSRAYTHWLRQKYDVIVVGAQTFIRDQPKLNVRDCALPHHRDPIPFIFDPKGTLLSEKTLPGSMRAFVCESQLKGLNSIPWVIPMEGEPASGELLSRFQKALESCTYSRPLQSVMVEGGARLLRLFLAEDRFDALHIFTGKKVFAKTNDRYRIQFKPSISWERAARQIFDEDLLHEWVKGF